MSLRDHREEPAHSPQAQPCSGWAPQPVQALVALLCHSVTLTLALLSPQGERLGRKREGHLGKWREIWDTEPRPLTLLTVFPCLVSPSPPLLPPHSWFSLDRVFCNSPGDLELSVLLLLLSQRWGDRWCHCGQPCLSLTDLSKFPFSFQVF